MANPAPIGETSTLRDLAARAAAASGPVERLPAESIPFPCRAIPAPAIAKRFASVSFETFVPRDASQLAALTTCRQFVTQAGAGDGPILALIGPPGCGKSHLLYSVARALHADRRRVEVRPWYRLADELRYGAADGREPADVRKQLLASEILLIDEVRPTASTEFDDTELTKLICNAWDNMHAVMFTTNVPVEELVGAHVVSRVRHMTIVGPDGRRST